MQEVEKGKASRKLRPQRKSDFRDLRRMVLYIYFSALCASFSGFLFGYDGGSLNGVKDMVGYRMTLNLSYNTLSAGENSSQSCNFEDDVETSSILGLIVALYSVGGVVGALCSGPLSDHIGRKPMLMLGGCLVCIGGLIHTAAVHLAMVLIGRLIAGLGTGIGYMVTPVYIGEIVPEHLRGRFISCLNGFAVHAYTLAVVINIFVRDISYGWRITLSIQFLAGMILAIGMIFPPRSPRWLVQHGKELRARKVLRYIYKDEQQVQRHLHEIKLQASSAQTFSSSLKFISRWKVFQRVLVGFIMILLGRFTGGIFVGYFSVSVFCKIGLPGFTVTVSIGLTAIFSMILSIIVIDKFGRKSMFLTGLGVMLISLLLSAVLITIYDLDSIRDQNQDISRNIVVAYIILILINIFICGFSVACANIPWIIMGELFPLPAKGFVISICSSAFWIGIVISNQLGPVLISSPLGVSGTLLVFSANVLFLFIFVLLSLPETKGISLEDVEKLYSMPWKDRVNVLYYLKCCCFVESCRNKVRTRSIEKIDTLHENNGKSSSMDVGNSLDLKLETTL